MADLKLDLSKRFVLRQVDFLLEDSDNVAYMGKLRSEKDFTKKEIEYSIDWLRKKKEDKWVELSDEEKDALDQYGDAVIDKFQNTKI